MVAYADQPRVAVAAAKQVGRAIFFSLAIIIVSFVPVFLLEAQEGRMFRPHPRNPCPACGGDRYAREGDEHAVVAQQDVARREPAGHGTVAPAEADVGCRIESRRRTALDRHGEAVVVGTARRGYVRAPDQTGRVTAARHQRGQPDGHRAANSHRRGSLASARAGPTGQWPRLLGDVQDRASAAQTRLVTGCW